MISKYYAARTCVTKKITPTTVLSSTLEHDSLVVRTVVVWLKAPISVNLKANIRIWPWHFRFFTERRFVPGEHFILWHRLKRDRRQVNWVDYMNVIVLYWHWPLIEVYVDWVQFLSALDRSAENTHWSLLFDTIVSDEMGPCFISKHVCMFMLLLLFYCGFTTFFNIISMRDINDNYIISLVR